MRSRPPRKHSLQLTAVGVLLLTLLLNLHAEESRIRNPYGLTEDEIEGLLVRSPEFRDFADSTCISVMLSELGSPYRR